MSDGSGPLPPWRQAAVGRRARKSEEEAAKKHGGRRQPASGAKWYAKGDVRANGYLVDDKFTDAASYTIKRDDWRKLSEQAIRTPPGMRPMLRISIPGMPTLIVMCEDDYLWKLADADAD